MWLLSLHIIRCSPAVFFDSVETVHQLNVLACVEECISKRESRFEKQLNNILNKSYKLGIY